MHWGAPIYLNFLLLIPALIIFFIIVSIRKNRAIGVFGNKALMEKLSLSKSAAKEKTKRILIIIGAIFLILALARPQIGTRLAMTKRSGVDVLIAIDTSTSMMAQDIKPNRLEKAKLEVASLIDKLKGDRVGILTFAGNSFVQCPLTLDYNAAKMFLSIVETGMMPKPGTAIGDAIERAAKSFVKKQRKHKVLVLLTDGEDHEQDPVKAAKEAKKEGIRIYTIGIGSKHGEPIPIMDESGNVSGYKKDSSGEVVMSRLDDETLQRIAFITDGKYYNATPGEFELDSIYDEIQGMEKKELSSRLFMQYEERFQYFLGIALALLCIELVIGDRKRT
ncbi:MAG: VWA domain-containing protein [Candidatus Omnitrophica bacterium]|nr:VWA domain-containing protein [Candidatus Omnitrophota bacterium]MBU4590410.1 VWA domain-containing protein [Candidatus Omnitrophota bacterium]